MITTPEQVGAELRRLRQAAGQTQADVARAVGVSRANLTQWETDRYLPSAENARLLDDHFQAANTLVDRCPEVTAAVVDALFQASTVLSAEDGLQYLKRSLDAYSRTRPFLLATALRTAVRLRPDAPFTRELADGLLATRLDFDGVLLWGEKKEEGLVAPEASAVHTARALVALRALSRNGDDRAEVEEAVEAGTEWLIGLNQPDNGVSEGLVLPQPHGEPPRPVNISHFTSAWVLQALTEAPRVPSSRFDGALKSLWERYEAGVGLWAWGSGDLPIWMTLDAVTALRGAALAFPASILTPP
ncbi:helix-turn-helix domain-containing protein [Amycolatopsis sp., V23-08]|uniref:Helix-turn-helix domain-containing protein n=1 Tax=Amycolatopsis heterodermiae TaxID=3110235 RepID=A0ABU5RLJ6_9PSEU|nr:helix-turn-helix domain-containing protein [Amycolatopsis sp., V23-08]MEA5367162.1 helix-turn-helix domain-containing protein [Amycolatopsis sp., V23-08]